MKYQYKIVVIKGSPMDRLTIDKLGAEGWWLVGIAPTKDVVVLDGAEPYYTESFWYYFLKEKGQHEDS